VGPPHHSGIAPAAESEVEDPTVGISHTAVCCVAPAADSGVGDPHGRNLQLHFLLRVQCRCDADMFRLLLPLLLLLPAVLLLLLPTLLLLLLLTSCTYGTTASLTGIKRT